MKKYSAMTGAKSIAVFLVFALVLFFSVFPASYAAAHDSSSELQNSESYYSDVSSELLSDSYFKPNEGQELIKIDDLSYGGQSNLEIGRQKLLDGGISQNFIDVMSDESIEELATSDYALKSSLYFIEQIADDGTSDLKRIDKETYNEARERSIQSLHDGIDIQSLLGEIEIVDNDGNLIAKTNSQDDIKRGEIEEDVDGSTVTVVMTGYEVINSGVEPHFRIISEYHWDTAPIFRGVDFFGITRDSSTVVIPPLFTNYYNYNYANYSLYAGPGGISETYLNSTPVNSSALPNEDSVSQGFAIRMEMGHDSVPQSVVVGTFGSAHLVYGISGGVMYDGTLVHPTLATYFNHWTTLLHQSDSFMLFESPTLSVPFGLSISVAPAAKYDIVENGSLSAYWPG